MTVLGTEARRFLRGQQNGVLSTISLRMEGYPFGSVTPFIGDHSGCPIVLISTLAEHTRNLEADPRCSLIVQPYSEDMQETGRLTLVGNAVRLDSKESLGPRYLRRFPQAETYFQMHDFNFYRIQPKRIRYIGGFGKIHWIEPEAYLCEIGSLGDNEAGIIDHMNQDHGESLAAYCRHYLGIEGDGARMIGIDPDGLDLRIGNRACRIDFTEPVLDAQSARQRLVDMTKASRT